MTQINSIASWHCDASVHYLDRANSSSLLITMWKKPSLIPQFLFAACTKVTMATHRGDVGRQVWEAYYISRSSSPLPGDPHHLQSQPQRQTIKPKISIFDDHICTWSRKLSATILGRHGVWNLTLLLWLTGFKSYFPVFAVEVCVDEIPKDVCPVWQRQGVEKLRHGQRSQLAKLWFQHRPQTENRRDRSTNVT